MPLRTVGLLMLMLSLGACDAVPGHSGDSPSSTSIRSNDPFAHSYASSCMRGAQIVDACGLALSYTQTRIDAGANHLVRPTRVDVIGSKARAVSVFETVGNIDSAKGDAQVVAGADFKLLSQDATSLHFAGTGAHSGWTLSCTFSPSRDHNTVETAVLTVPL